MISGKPHFPSETSASPRNPDLDRYHVSDSPVILALGSFTAATKATAFDLDGHVIVEARRGYLHNTPGLGR